MKKIFIGTVLLLSVMTAGVFANNAADTAQLYKKSVSASGNETGNVPIHVLDGDIGTKWAMDGDGHWLQFALDESQSFSEIGIAFPNGNKRNYYFDICVSDDMEQWQTVFTGQSAGQSEEVEVFSFPDVQAKYLRIVGHKNSVNVWNNVSEVTGLPLRTMEIGITIEGAMQMYDVMPVIENGRTLVPMRRILESFGAEVSWDEATRTVTAVKKDTTVQLTVDSTAATVNGEAKTLDVPARELEGRVLVPVRFLAESFGIAIDWNEAEWIVEIGEVDPLSPEVQEALARLDALLPDSILEWSASMYDPETGGFYACASARDTEGFLPDIESSGMIMGHIGSAGHSINQLPKEIREKTAAWARSMQDPADGYFYQPQWGKDIGDAKRNRELMFAKQLINNYGGGAFLYPLPEERIQEAAKEEAPEDGGGVPEYIQSPEALTAWMEELWSTRNAGSAAHMINSAKSLIVDAGLADTAIAFFESKQNPETGLLSDDFDYQIGARSLYKMAEIYSAAGREMQYVDKMIPSLITIFRTADDLETIVDPYNAVNALLYAYQSYGENVPEEIQALVEDNFLTLAEVICDTYETFQKPDGGYSYYPDKGMDISQGSQVGLGLVESDFNSPGKVLSSRNAMYKLLGLTAPKAYSDEAFAKWVDTIVNAQPEVKK